MNQLFTPPSDPRAAKMTAAQFAEHAHITLEEAERVLAEAAAEKERLEHENKRNKTRNEYDSTH